MNIAGLISIAILGSWSSAAIACMVKGLSVPEKTQVADVILVGEITRVGNMASPTKTRNSFIEVKVIKAIKGIATGAVKLYFHSSRGATGHSQCNPEYANYQKDSVGSKWVFYAQKRERVFFTSFKLSGNPVGAVAGGKNLADEEVAEIEAQLKKR